MPYSFADFEKACNDPSKVAVSYDAKKGAEKDFNLLTESALLAFIGSGGLEDAVRINTDVWRFNPRKPPDIDVDSYSFYSGRKYGYIAFMFVPWTAKWSIKSFKINTEPNLREIETNLNYLPFQALKELVEKKLDGE